MSGKQRFATAGVAKCPTGIVGFDELVGGGLPRGRSTLVTGGPGAGKTVFALQTLVNGAKDFGEAGIFVAFEEHSRELLANAASFGWGLERLTPNRLFVLDAQPDPELMRSGDFDLKGMLAALSAKVRQTGARRVVFDALDVVLHLLDDPQAAHREIFRLRDWLLEHGLTAVLTSKIHREPNEMGREPSRQPDSYLQFIVDCAVVLNHEAADGMSQRNLRVIKYRGSAFAENAAPFVLGESGLSVAAGPSLDRSVAATTTERVSSGIPRLDAMLGGGYFRGASVLITGAPGTAKTSLCGAFAEAACRRGERTLFVSFDSGADEIGRNLQSVNIRLNQHRRSGRLRLVSPSSGGASAEMQFSQIKRMVAEHRARHLIIDPLSALALPGNLETARGVVERLGHWVKSEGITLLATSLLDGSQPEDEGTPLQISTLADTWLHVSYLVRHGERNRALTIIKSRGTQHSNQVRELVLRTSGISLEDVYTAGGEVLMGALRFEKEAAVRAAAAQAALEEKRERVELENSTMELMSRIKQLERELALKRAQRESLGVEAAKRAKVRAAGEADLKQLRGADATRRPKRQARP